MKTQKVRILVAVAKDGSYMASGSGERGEITDPDEQRGWVCDGLPDHVEEGEYHYVVVEAEVPLPPDIAVEGTTLVDQQALEHVVRTRRDAERADRDGIENIEMLRRWLRGLHMKLVGGWDQDTSQDRIAELLGEHPRGHAREFKVRGSNREAQDPVP